MSKLKEVELVSTGIFLPGDPIPYDKIEEVIGFLDQASHKTQKLINKLRPAVKDLIGIDQCHFAIDLETKKVNETNSTMTVKAIQKALKKAKMTPADLEFIVLANPLPDYMTPPTTTLVQEQLQIERCAEIEVHSNCTGLSKAFQIAFDALRVGRFKTAAVAYSQLSSAYLRSAYINHQKVKTEDLLLRWFLSDSASALILKAHDKQSSGISVLQVYNESVGGRLKPAMWTSIGGAEFDLLKLYEGGTHHLSQNYTEVSKIGPGILAQALEDMLDLSGINKESINHLLATVPSVMLMDRVKEIVHEKLGLSPAKWFSNVSYKGYSGGSSIIIGLDEMIDNNIFKAGETLACTAIESSKWMVGGFILKHS